METEVRLGPWWARTRLDISVAAEAVLRLEEQHLVEASGVKHRLTHLYDSSKLRRDLQRFMETSVLMRALTWVKASSQNAQVCRYIEAAALTARPKVEHGHPSMWYDITAILNWCTWASMKQPFSPFPLYSPQTRLYQHPMHEEGHLHGISHQRQLRAKNGICLEDVKLCNPGLVARRSR